MRMTGFVVTGCTTDIQSRTYQITVMSSHLWKTCELLISFVCRILTFDIVWGIGMAIIMITKGSIGTTTR